MATHRTKTRFLNAVRVEDALGSDATRPGWLITAIKAGKAARHDNSLHIKTDGADLICNSGDWILYFEDGNLACASDADFIANYEAIGQLSQGESPLLAKVISRDGNTIVVRLSEKSVSGDITIVKTEGGEGVFDASKHGEGDTILVDLRARHISRPVH